jgi:hypothetical protein
MIKSLSRKFPLCPSAQIANPAHLQGKKSSVSDPDPYWFASKFFYLRNYIL